MPTTYTSTRILNFAIPGGLNVNQQNVGNALTNFFNTTGGIPTVFANMSASGLSQASGETATGAQQTTFDAMTQFMGVMTDPFTAGRGTPESGSGGLRRRNTGLCREALLRAMRWPLSIARLRQWHRRLRSAGTCGRRAFGGARNTDGNTVVGSNDTRSSIGGVAVGADYWFSPNTAGGLLAGWRRHQLLGGHRRLRAAATCSRLVRSCAIRSDQLTSQQRRPMAGRISPPIGLSAVIALRAQFNANSYSGRIEGGNRYLMPWLGGLGLTPYAAAQVTALDLPSYAETAGGGANTFALAYAGKTVTSTRIELGFRTDKSFAVTDAILTLRGRVAWAHDFNTDRFASATFQTLPGASFVVNGAAQARDAALTTASAEMKWTNGWAVAGTFEGEFSDVTRSYAGKGVVRYAW